MIALERLLDLDQKVSARLAIPYEARYLRWGALIAAHSGDSPLWLLGAALALGLDSSVWREVGQQVIVGTLAAGTTILALKWLFRRQRPPGEGRGFYTRVDRHAFPSGHAGRSACMVVLLSPCLSHWWGNVLLALWAGLVGLARIGLGVHFVSDIIGGWAVGLLVGMALRIAL
jgi:undecaprenyl-diphosphatase